MRKLLYGLVGLIVLVVAAAFIVPSLIDFNAYKGEIQSKAREATGRDLVIDGNVRLTILPSPQLSAEGVRFANLPGSDVKDMAQLKSLRVSVALLPLVTGNIEVTQVTLVGATVTLETLADGRSNWELGGARPQGGTAGAATGSPAPKSGSSISVKDLAIEDSTLIWRDARAGRAVRLDAVNGRLSADTLEGPFSGRLAFKAGQVPVDLELRSGALGDQAVPVFAVVKTTGGEIRLEGKISDGKTDPKFDGSLKSSGDSLAALLQSLTALSGARPGALPQSLAQKFSITSTVSGSRQQIALNGLKVELGDDSGSGDVLVRLGPPLRADLKLAFAKLDIDKLLVGSKPAAPPQGAPSTPTPSAPPSATASSGLPANVEGSLDISVGTVLYQGKTAQNVVLKGDLSKGALTIANIGGQFPGNTVIAASGSVGGARSPQSGSGKVEIHSARLREFLSWLDIDTSQVPADRLNAFAFTGQIAATPEGDVQIANAAMQLDGTNAKGAVTIKTTPRLAVIADLDIDTLNVDAYTGAAKSPKPGDKASATHSGAYPIDAIVKARIAHLIVDGKQIDGIDVDVTVAPDKLTFRPSRIANVGGATAKWNGTISAYGSATPLIDLTLDLQTPDTDKLLQLAGLAPPFKDRRIGPLSASGRIAGKSDDLTFNNFALTAMGGSIRLTGRFAQTAQGPTYNFSHMELKADDGDRLLGLLGIAPGLGGQKLGPVSISGAAQGNLDQANIDLDINALAASLDLKGTVSGLRGTPALAMQVGLDHPDFARMMRTVSPGFNGGQGVGAVKLQMRLDGSPAHELRITNLHGNLGAATIAGSITANLGTPVPSVTASLDTGVLELDKILALGQKAELTPPRPFYPANVLPASFGDDTQVAQAPGPKIQPKNQPSGPTGGQTGGQGGHFSSQPLNVAVLHSIDAKIDLKSQALVMAPWRVDNAVAAIDLRDGMLHVNRLTGRAFDGDFSLTGVLNASRLPASLDVKFNIVKLDMSKLSRAIHHKDRFDGDVNVDFALTSSGSSEAALVANLDGSGNVGGTIQFNAKVQEVLLGAVAGQAAKAVDKYLGKFTGQGNFDSGGDINAAINVALQRFANRENPISGNIAIRNGVASSSNLRVIGRQARADTNFTANLPAWTLDATTNVFLDEHPSQSYLIVTNRGPLDSPNLKIDRNDSYAGSNSQQQPSQQQTQPQQPNSQDPSTKKKISPLDLFKKK